MAASAGGQSRPWEQRQRAQRDRSGIGAGKRVRFDADETQRKKPWFTHRGKDAAEQRAALKRDYEANLAEINARAFRTFLLSSITVAFPLLLRRCRWLFLLYIGSV